jgi:predicted  nucleic acid-binding Zn-ribbon protein
MWKDAPAADVKKAPTAPPPAVTEEELQAIQSRLEAMRDTIRRNRELEGLLGRCDAELKLRESDMQGMRERIRDLEERLSGYSNAVDRLQRILKGEK